MSVVYLPEDKRWSMVGEGIGSLVGAFVSRKLIDSDNKRAMQQVHDINSDDTIKPEDKPYRIFEVAGPKGLAITNALLKQQQAGITTAHTQAETDLARSRNVQVQQQTQTQAQTAPLQQQKLAGEVAAQPLQRANIASEISARETQAPLTAAHTQVETQEGAERLKEKQQERDALANALAQSHAPPGIDENAWRNIQWQGLLGGPTAAASGIAAQTKAQTEAAQVGPKAEARVKAEQEAKQGTMPLPPAVAATVANSDRLIEGLEQTIKGVVGNPKTTGGPGTFVKSFLAEHGLTQADPVFAQQLANTHQLVQQIATSGSGFIGSERIKLAKTIAPSLLRGKVLDVTEANALASDTLAYLEGQKANYTPEGKPGQFITGGLDAAIDRYKKFVDYTGSLWSSADGKVTFFDNKRVDPNTFKQLPDGDIKLEGHTYRTEDDKIKIGASSLKIKDIVDGAKAKGLTPEQAVEALRVQIGAP